VSIAAASFSTILSQSAFSPFLPLISESLNTSVALLGQAPGISMLVAGLLGLVVGPLADRYGQRRALLLGLLALAASAVGVALAQSYLVFLVVMLVSAVGRATILPVSMVIGGTRFVGDAQRRALSWMSTGMTAATILGVPFLTTIGELVTWRGAFLTLAAMALGAAGLVWYGLGPDLPVATGRFRMRDILTAYTPIIRNRPAMLFLLASLVGNIGQWNVYTYTGAYWTDVHQLSLHEIGLTALVQGFGGLAGSWLMSTPVGKISPRRLLIVSRFLGGLMCAAPFVLPMPVVAAVACFTLSYVVGGMGAIASTLQLTRDVPSARATALTLNGAAWSIGIALGAASGGLALALGGYDMLGIMAFSTFAAASGLLLISDRVAPVSR
jgi:predicted MFS family arabinose efflux permease